MQAFFLLLFMATVSAKAPLFKSSEPIPGKYIVILKDGFDVDFVAAQVNGQVDFKWKRAINGFVVQLSDQAVDAVRQLSGVEYVEEDGLMRAKSTCTVPSHLDRIDQRSLPLDGIYQPSVGNGGSGSTAWVIDTGVRATHIEFDPNRAQQMVNYAGGNNEDCAGHGTHCAGVIGGSCVGVAPNIQIRGVKVLNCFGAGSTSGIISGIDYVANNANSNSVAALSVGGGASTALDSAVNNLVSSGVPVAVPAGNQNADACNYSPCRASQSICAGATDSSDRALSSSNYGNCVDIFAPGSNVNSSWYTSDTAYFTLSGSSVAACQVAGGLALYGKSAGALLSAATSGRIINPGVGSPNLLLYV